MKTREDRCSVPATNLRPKPVDFPIGSLESRVAARMLAKTRAGQHAKEPYFYQAHFDTETVIYDYVTGLPISEEQAADKLPQLQQQNETSISAPLPVPGESIDDPPNPPRSQTQPRVITVEVG
jgi:hypothetical protein